METTVIKLGGSLLTDKTKPYSLRLDVIKQIASEIKQCMDEGIGGRFVIVQGVGSYGHPPVLEYKLYKGFIAEEQLWQISWTQSKVDELRRALAESLQVEGIPVIMFTTSSIFSSTEQELDEANMKPLAGYLGIGMVPLIGGDMIYDTGIGFRVMSGDLIAYYLAKELDATRLIFATDVKGVSDKDPKTFSDARLLQGVKTSEIPRIIDEIKGNNPHDASGAIVGKLQTIQKAAPLIKKGLDVAILSMMEPGTLRAYLKGEPVKATDFTA